MKTKSLAIIPARGGSKRLPGKNIRNFFGQPIIKYVIDAAKNSNCFAEVMVSTDDQKIAQVSKKCGAVVPFLRSAENSGDKATIVNALLEVLDAYKKRGVDYDYICCLFPTAPFITPKVLKTAIKILKAGKADSVVPVVKYFHPIQRAFRIKGGNLTMLHPENMFLMTQDLEETYYDVGQFYFMNTRLFTKHKKLFLPITAPIIVDEDSISDIDTLEDWKKAERKFLAKKTFRLK